MSAVLPTICVLLMQSLAFNSLGFAHDHDDESSVFVDLTSTAPMSAEQQKQVVEAVHESIEGPHTHGRRNISQFLKDTLHSLNFYERYLNARRVHNIAGDSESPGASYVKDAVFYFLISHPLEILVSWGFYTYGYYSGWSASTLAATAAAAVAVSLPTGFTDPVCGILQTCLLFPWTRYPLNKFRGFVEYYTVTPIVARLSSTFRALGGDRLIKFGDASRFLAMVYAGKQRAQIRIYELTGKENEAVASVNILTQNLTPFLNMRVHRGLGGSLYIADLSISEPSRIDPLDFGWIDQLLRPLGINTRNAMRHILVALAKKTNTHQLTHDFQSFLLNAHRHGDHEIHFTFHPRSLDIPGRWEFPFAKSPNCSSEFATSLTPRLEQPL